MRYIAVIHKDHDSVYGVSFPDFPGCVSAGETLDDAVANAAEALRGHVQVMEADGDAVPLPRSLDTFVHDVDEIAQTIEIELRNSPKEQIDNAGE